MSKYHKVCEELLRFLPERTKDIVSRRFGIGGKEKETLDGIGRDYEITRERVRQIEKEGIRKIKNKAEGYGDVFHELRKKIDFFGGIKREDVLLGALSEETVDQNCVFFLLNIDEKLTRVPESKDFYPFWRSDENAFTEAKKEIEKAYEKLKKENRPLTLSEIKGKRDVVDEKLLSYLEISKKVVQNDEGEFGIFNWPEIKPKGIKDKAYIILNKKGEPLHFREIASALGDDANPQTTHNELIKDPRFVLVGRGVYALSKWGYTPGEVKEVIRDILEKEGALPKEEIISQVTKQRIVKKNTVVQNLSNKKYFIRTPDGKYTLA